MLRKNNAAIAEEVVLHYAPYYTCFQPDVPAPTATRKELDGGTVLITELLQQQQQHSKGEQQNTISRACGGGC